MHSPGEGTFFKRITQDGEPPVRREYSKKERDAKDMGKTMGKYLFMMLLTALLTLFVVLCHKTNNTENVIYFTGQSDNWKAVIVYTYQESWSIGKNNTWQYHSVDQERPLLKYKNAGNREIGQLEWEYSSQVESESATDNDPKVDRFGHIFFPGYSGGNGALMRADGYYTMTVQWDGGKKETFKLVASEK